MEQLSLNDFQYMIGLSVWVGIVLIHGFAYRSIVRPEADPIRPSGPIESERRS